MPCLRHKALNMQMREKISQGGKTDRSRSGSRSRNRCRSRSSTYASRSRSRSRERTGTDEDDDDNTGKTAPPKPRRSRNDLNQQNCGHHGDGVISIPIHTPDRLKSALKKPESKVVNVPIHTSGRSRSRSGEHCPPINIPIHMAKQAPPQKERSTIRPWIKSSKDESTVKTWSDYSSHNNASVRMWKNLLKMIQIIILSSILHHIVFIIIL